MVHQAQLILFYYRLHVSTYIQVTFRPFLTRESVNTMNVGIPSVHKDKVRKIHKMFMYFIFVNMMRSQHA
jgi:hypothetical protein